MLRSTFRIFLIVLEVIYIGIIFYYVVVEHEGWLELLAIIYRDAAENISAFSSLIFLLLLVLFWLIGYFLLKKHKELFPPSDEMLRIISKETTIAMNFIYVFFLVTFLVGIYEYVGKIFRVLFLNGNDHISGYGVLFVLFAAFLLYASGKALLRCNIRVFKNPLKTS